MSVWITQASARTVSASTQMVPSAVNVHLDTTWITLESTALTLMSVPLETRVEMGHAPTWWEVLNVHAKRALNQDQ